MDIPQLADKMKAFVQTKGWYNPDSLRPQTACNQVISLSLEAGEVLEHFQWCAQVEDEIAFQGELADVFLYLLQFAQVTGINLEQVVLDRLTVNSTRGWDVGPCRDRT
jgi:8-oxo-dGTP diphosphatase